MKTESQLPYLSSGSDTCKDFNNHIHKSYNINSQSSKHPAQKILIPANRQAEPQNNNLETMTDRRNFRSM